MTKIYDDPSFATQPTAEIENMQGQMRNGFSSGEDISAAEFNYLMNLHGEIAKKQSGSVVYDSMRSFIENTEIGEMGIVDELYENKSFFQTVSNGGSIPGGHKIQKICTNGEFVFAVEKRTLPTVEMTIYAFYSDDLSTPVASEVFTAMHTTNGIKCHPKQNDLNTIYVCAYGSGGSRGRIYLYEFNRLSLSFSSKFDFVHQNSPSEVFDLDMANDAIYFISDWKDAGRINYSNTGTFNTVDWREAYTTLLHSVSVSGGKVFFSGGDHQIVKNVWIYDDDSVKTFIDSMSVSGAVEAVKVISDELYFYVFVEGLSAVHLVEIYKFSISGLDEIKKIQLPKIHPTKIRFVSLDESYIYIGGMDWSLNYDSVTVIDKDLNLLGRYGNLLTIPIADGCSCGSVFYNCRNNNNVYRKSISSAKKWKRVDPMHSKNTYHKTYVQV